MKKKSDLILSIIALISFVGCVVFLYLSFTNNSNTNLFLSLALGFTILGNGANLINSILKKRRKKEEQEKESE